MSTRPTAAQLSDAYYLVDCSSYIFRAYYAIQSGLKAPDGTPTHATFGFLQMLQSLLGQHNVKHLVLVWDSKEKNFRYNDYADYKANRSAPPEDLGVQIDNSKKMAELLGYAQLEAPGFEADDILATLVKKNPQATVVVVTSDKDLLQLVGERVWCLDTLKDKWSNAPEALEKFGVEPERIREVQALCGDSVDNVPGVEGIGPKSAAELIQYYGDLETLLKEAAERHAKGETKGKDKADPLKGKRIESLATQADMARISLKLVSLSDQAPVPSDLEKLQRSAPKAEEAKALAKQLGFAKVVDRFLEGAGSGEGGRAASASASVPQGDLSRGAEAKASAANAFFHPHAILDVPSFKELLSKNAKAQHLALDTETFSLDKLKQGNLVGISLSFDGNDAYYVPLRHSTLGAFSGGEPGIRELLQELQHFLHKNVKQLRIYFQNGKFDRHILASEGLEWPEDLQEDDSMLMSFVLDPSERHGMDALAFKYLDNYETLPFDTVLGDLPDFSHVPVERATFYAAEDAAVTYRLCETLRTRLQSEHLWAVYEQLDRPLLRVLWEMERSGVCLDQGVLKKLSTRLHGELEQLERDARECLAESKVELAEDFNLASPKQVAKVLFEQLGLPVLKKNKTGPSTDVDVLEELALQHPFPKYLLTHRELSKLLGTYVDALPELINPTTGRLHTEFSQTVAATGRLASSNPNLQNIPIRTERGRLIRDAFRAAPGYVLVGVDYSQVELRVLAHMSGDAQLLRAFQEDADIHRRTAALVLGKNEEKIGDDERRMAKTINFGIVYGQTAFGLSKTLGIPQKEAKAFIDAYFKTYPGIRAYMDEAIGRAKKQGWVSTLTGRRRLLPELQSKNPALRAFGERMAINSPVQGTAADLMKAAMLRVHRDLKRLQPKARMLLQVHDELLFEVPERDAARVKELVVEGMQDPCLLSGLGVERLQVLMKAEAAIGEHWGAL